MVKTLLAGLLMLSAPSARAIEFGSPQNVTLQVSGSGACSGCVPASGGTMTGPLTMTGTTPINFGDNGFAKVLASTGPMSIGYSSTTLAVGQSSLGSGAVVYSSSQVSGVYYLALSTGDPSGQIDLNQVTAAMAYDPAGQATTFQGTPGAGQMVLDSATGSVSLKPAGGASVSVGNGGQEVYRCTVAGALPVGTLTVTPANCGASVDTHLNLP